MLDSVYRRRSPKMDNFCYVHGTTYCHCSWVHLHDLENHDDENDSGLGDSPPLTPSWSAVGQGEFRSSSFHSSPFFKKRERARIINDVGVAERSWKESRDRRLFAPSKILFCCFSALYCCCAIKNCTRTRLFRAF